ncbi:MAG TPA: hypothetical protein PLQ67_07845 [Burkholderiaceae bacterium]|nr:hypothetical protein [Burkholderiaceae bacterium]
MFSWWGAAVRRLRWGLAVAAALGLFGCAQMHHPLPIRPSAGPIEDAGVFGRVLRRAAGGDAGAPAAPSDGLWPAYATAQSRRQLALTIWSLVEQRYYDPGLNGASWAQAKALDVELAANAQSDAAFYAALKQMLGRLGDSHSQVLTPVESAQFHQFAGPTVGLHFRPLDGRLVVVDVELDSPGARSGVRPGDVLRAVGSPGAALTRIDAQFFEQAQSLAASGPMIGIYKDPALRALMALLRPLLSQGIDGSGAAGIVFEFERFADASQAARGGVAGQWLRLTLIPERTVRPAQAQLRWLEGDIAWLTFNRFAPELRPWLEDALDAATKAQGIVVDLRGNGGGAPFPPEELLETATGIYLRGLGLLPPDR